MTTPDGMFAYGFCQTGVSAAVSKVLTVHLHLLISVCQRARNSDRQSFTWSSLYLSK